MSEFDSRTFESHKAEVKEKWGATRAYREYKEKKHSYSAQQWNDAIQGIEQIMAEFADCMKSEKAPDSNEAQSLVKKLQSFITDNFYNCTNGILAALGQMYVTDERFRNSIDKHAEGTAEFIFKATEAYCNI